MKYFAIALIVMLSSGCTSLKPIEMMPEQLHEKIVSENIVKTGDKIKVVTSDGKRYKFKVTAVEHGHILGRDISIAIEDIIALETVSFSGGKTSALVGVTVLWLYIVLLSIPAIVAI